MFDGFLRFVGTTGEIGAFGAKTTRELFRRPWEIGELIRQIYECGAKSTPLIVGTGLARALVLDPPIIMVDEPSSGLDAFTASEIYDLLSKLRERKKTLVIVTHDGAGLSGIVDDLAVLDRASIVACAKPDELARSDNQLVRELVGGRER